MDDDVDAEVDAEMKRELDAAEDTIPCPMCQGTGVIQTIVDREQCYECHGTGRITL